MAVQPLTGFERAVAATVTGATSVSMTPLAFLAWKLGLYLECVLGLFGAVTALIYHLCQTLSIRILSYDMVTWNRVDTLFAINALTVILLGFAQLPRPSWQRELIMTTAVGVQTSVFTLGDFSTYQFLAALVAAPVVCFWQHRRPPRLDWRYFAAMLLVSPGAFFCYNQGLDDEIDRLRLWHGTWHVAITVCAVLAMRAQNPPWLRPPRPGADLGTDSRDLEASMLADEGHGAREEAGGEATPGGIDMRELSQTGLKAGSRTSSNAGADGACAAEGGLQARRGAGAAEAAEVQPSVIGNSIDTSRKLTML